MIIQNNKIYTIGSFTGTYDELPKGTYRLRQDSKSLDFYLLKTEDFKLPKKLYGDLSCVDRIINTFNARSGNLSVLLVGERGSGKTLTAKKICIESGLPVIIIDEVFEDSDLISFLSSPELKSCVVFIDEYEKLYADRSCEVIMLQLLDGACNSKHLYLLTANAMNRINSHLINRPSRIFYRKIYGGISDETLKEILDNELINQSWRKEIEEVFDKFTTVTFDIAMSLITEVNLYDESPIKCAELMNFTPENVFAEITQVFSNGAERLIDCSWIDLNKATVEIQTYDNSKEDSDYHWIDYKTEDLQKISNGIWQLNVSENFKFIIKRKNQFNLLF